MGKSLLLVIFINLGIVYFMVVKYFKGIPYDFTEVVLVYGTMLAGYTGVSQFGAIVKSRQMPVGESFKKNEGKIVCMIWVSLIPLGTAATFDYLTGAQDYSSIGWFLSVMGLVACYSVGKQGKHIVREKTVSTVEVVETVEVSEKPKRKRKRKKKGVVTEHQEFGFAGT